MTHFRTFRNGDPPALAGLWNLALPARATARPLSGHEFDTHVINKPHFDPAGLIIAEREGRIVGFAHGGFGPDLPASTPNRLTHELGTIAMLVLQADQDEAELGAALIAETERYLRDHGARVLYAGGQCPLNPFYWGVYGGSEWAGILTSHASFVRCVVRAGYEAINTTVLLEADLNGAEVRDPRSALIRRQARLEVIEDVLPLNWWEAQAIGEFRPTRFRLLSKVDNRELAHATTWDMNWFGRLDGCTRIGLIDLEVSTADRRKGYGRHLIAEILRHARSEMVSRVSVQTSATNAPALALYESLRFEPVETALLYRRPGQAGAPGTP